MQVREANQKDFEELLELILKCTIYHHDLDKKMMGTNKLIRGSVQELRKKESKELNENLKKSDTKILVAIIENKLVGFIILSFPAKNANIKSKRGEIDDFFVLEEYRKKKVGKMLFEKAFSLFKSKKVKLISLDVSSNNYPALKFYEKFCFKESMKRMYLCIE